MRVTDLFIIMPLLVLAAVLGRIASGGKGGIWTLALMLGFVTWTGLARLVRGEVLSLREREFVAAARAVGTGARRIIVKHILPNTVGVIIVSATLSIAAAILLETSLSYLGFGVRAPDTSLGLLISDYENAFKTRPWLFWWPGMFILAIRFRKVVRNQIIYELPVGYPMLSHLQKRRQKIKHIMTVMVHLKRM